MATPNTVPAQLYPLASSDGKDIPFDVLKPVGLAYYSFNAGSPTEIALPASAELATIFATADAVVFFGTAALPLNSYADGALFVPANTIVTAQLPATTLKIKGITFSGLVYIQVVQKWAALALPRQFEKR